MAAALSQWMVAVRLQGVVFSFCAYFRLDKQLADVVQVV